MGLGGGTGERAQCWAEQAAEGPEGRGEACQRQAVEEAAEPPAPPGSTGLGRGGTSSGSQGLWSQGCPARTDGSGESWPAAGRQGSGRAWWRGECCWRGEAGVTSSRSNVVANEFHIPSLNSATGGA